MAMRAISQSFSPPDFSHAVLQVLRKCSVTGHDITPIRAVPQQQALV